MNNLKETVGSVLPEIKTYSSKSGLTFRRQTVDGIRSCFYVKDVGNKYFVTITQRKQSFAAASGGAIVEVKRSYNLVGADIGRAGAGEIFDVKSVFGPCTEELLAATRYISGLALQHTTKTLLFAVALIDYSKPNLQLIASDLENIVLKFHEL